MSLQYCFYSFVENSTNARTYIMKNTGYMCVMKHNGRKQGSLNITTIQRITHNFWFLHNRVLLLITFTKMKKRCIILYKVGYANLSGDEQRLNSIFHSFTKTERAAWWKLTTVIGWAVTDQRERSDRFCVSVLLLFDCNVLEGTAGEDNVNVLVE